jgi:SAM-dependent methyltransferase
MIHHSELINYLINKFSLRSYLEIGTFNRGHNFDLINVEWKKCVDPDPNAQADFIETSDDFFMRNSEGCNGKFDIIFIDGLHHADQVKKDFDNALQCLAPGGFIVLHDCNPPSEATTCVPRGAQREWCGDVFKFACRLCEYSGIDFLTLDFDYGCAVVWRDSTRVGTPVNEDITWEYFQKNKGLLRLTAVHDFIDLCEVDLVESA